MAYVLKEPKVTCKDCGIIFTRKSPKTIRCPECRRQYVLKREREYSRERYAELKGTSDANMGTLACDYILATGHRRGCPAGVGCDKRQTGKRKKKALRI